MDICAVSTHFNIFVFSRNLALIGVSGYKI